MDKLNIFIAGDFYGGNEVAHLIDKNDYQTIFGPLLQTIQKSDISVVNLESPLFYDRLIPIPKTGPNIKAKPNVLEALKFAGFDLLTLANNHILDYGAIGLECTIESIKNYGLQYVGAGCIEAEKRGIKFISKKDKKVAFLNFCENEWSTSELNQPGANRLNLIDNFTDIRIAKENADYAIVVLHGSVEHFRYPTIDFVKTCKFFIDAGADTVICHHTHVVSGYEVYKEKPIFYGIGNFLFDNKKNNNSDWKIGCAVKLSLDRNILFEIIPFWQCRNFAGIEAFNDSENQQFSAQLQNINQVISNSERLSSEFDDWCNKRESIYDSYIQPYNNRFLRGLFKRKLIPSLHSRGTYMLLLNLIRCESHREVLVRILKNKS